MGQTFKIKPGDQSLVEKKIIIASGYNCADAVPRFDFELYEEPKKKVLMAPAIVYQDDGALSLTDRLYKNYEVPQKEHERYFVSWPAIPNKDGFYEVPE